MPRRCITPRVLPFCNSQLCHWILGKEPDSDIFVTTQVIFGVGQKQEWAMLALARMRRNVARARDVFTANPQL